jgi:hypothetical protein
MGKRWQAVQQREPRICDVFVAMSSGARWEVFVKRPGFVWSLRMLDVDTGCPTPLVPPITRGSEELSNPARWQRVE